MVKPASKTASYSAKPTTGMCITPAGISSSTPGHVEFIPATIIDPTRSPLRNPLRC
jgi:hypothetical protein